MIGPNTGKDPKKIYFIWICSLANAQLLFYRWENSLALAEIQKVILMVIYNLPIAYVRQFTG